MLINAHHCTCAYSIVLQQPHYCFLSWSEICCCLVHQFLPSLFSPDPSLTAENVSSVLGTLRDWRTVSGVLSVPLSREQIIETTFSTETARRQAAVDSWLRYSPTASWTWLAGQLYSWKERTALEAVSQYIHKETAGTDNFQPLTPALQFTVHNAIARAFVWLQS